MSEPSPIAFVDLQAQRARLGSAVDDAIAEVLRHGRFIHGPEVAAFESELADFCGVGHVVGCGSGTDALVLGLLALGVGPGDAVLVPTFTFAATAEAVALVGATPVFLDVETDTFNVATSQIGAAVDAARDGGLRPVGIIPVDLFGQPADYGTIETEADRHGLWVFADAAQSLGASAGEQRVGRFGALTATSFFPAKPLGCYGDGGAVLTDDADLAALLRSLRVHGQGANKYDNVRIGLNARLDTIQAAVLRAKLGVFTDELAARQAVADRYAEGLAEVVEAPVVPPGVRSAWAQYTIQVDDRDQVSAALSTDGIPTAVYYVKPLHRQPAYAQFPRAMTELGRADRLSQRVLSLPMHPYLTGEDQQRVIDSVRRAVAGADHGTGKG